MLDSLQPQPWSWAASKPKPMNLKAAGLDQQVAQPRSPALQAKLVNDVSAVPVPATVLRQTDGLSAYLASGRILMMGVQPADIF